MSKLFQAVGTVVLLFGVLVAAAGTVSADRRAAPGDVARFVAGMQPSANSPLTALTSERSWQLHANHFNQAWKALEQRQLNPIAAWQEAYLPKHSDFMLYLFSGPDFLYANAFFPNATTYVFTGLEPVGNVPSVTDLSPGARASSLQALRSSMQTIVNISFFITKKMKEQLRAGSLTGTLPVIYVFMARAGMNVEKVELITLKTDGTIVPASAKKRGADAPGAKITFSGRDRKTKTLYYFQTDLSNGGMKYNGLSKFVESQGTADALIKSASYLMHGGNFTTTRNLILKQSGRILQDDSGIPLRIFDRETWDFRPFGYYLGPIAIFSNQYQRDMQQLFSRQNTTPIEFGFGYKWRKNQSNVLLATRKIMPKSEAVMEPEEETEPEPEMKTEEKSSTDDTEAAMAEPETDTKMEEEASIDVPGEAMTKPAAAAVTTGSVAAPSSTLPMLKSSEDETDTEPSVDVAALSSCRANCASVYEPCRVSADQRMDACFSSNDAEQCQTTWKDEAGQCINKRLECLAKCN